LKKDRMPLPERHFLGWTESAALSVARWLHERRDTLATNQSGVLDFTNTLVIVPGKCWRHCEK